MSALPKTHFTPEEYLSLELAAKYKSQYVAGEIFAMAGAEPWHVRIADNLAGMLYTRLRGQPREYFTSDMRVRIEAAEMYTYPDLSALCGEPKFEPGDHPQSLLNPQAIFEVLSPSTEAFDRGEKFACYRRLPTLIDYVLAASTRMHIEHHIRQPSGVWTCAEHSLPSEHVKLTSLDCVLPLAEIYERVRFPDGTRPIS